MGSGNTRRLGVVSLSINVSLCVSGKWTGEDYTNLLRERIPHDNFYTATYTESGYDADFYIDEPELTYHPLDIDPYPDYESHGRRDAMHPDIYCSPEVEYVRQVSPHWHKQILIHNHIMKNIDTDIVVRARFETIVSDQVDWEELIKKSWEEEMPLGFNTRNVATNLKHHHVCNDNEYSSFFINDAMIIHPQRIWDCNLVERLYNEEKLRGAEEGWYQVLSEPYDYYHTSYNGGAYSAKDWEMVLDVDASLHNHTS